MRKITASLLSLLLAFTMFASTAFAAEQPVSVQFNGQPVEFGTQAPFIEEGTTLVPAAPLFEALGLTLTSSEQPEQVIGTKDDLVIKLAAGIASAEVNGKSIELTQEPKAVKGVLYIPARFVSEAVGYTVSWDPDGRTVIIAEGGRGFLWEVQHNGNTVYLLGSMHIADGSFYPLRPEIENALQQSDYLGVEVDVTKAADPAVQQLILELGSYQDGTTLKDHISAEAYALLGEILSENGLPANAMDQFKPWTVETVIASLQSAGSGYEAQVGIDMYIAGKALEAKMPIIELESYDFQLNMFNSFSAELQQYTLLETLKNYKQVGTQMNQMAEVWKTGNEEGLLGFVESFKFSDEYYKAMIIDRNKGMAEKIAGYLNGEDKAVYFIMVGAAHYPGEDGIIKLLQDQGFTVTKI